MNRFNFVRWLICLCFACGLPAAIYAGDDAVRTAPQTGTAAAAAQMGAYLQAQKVTHTVDVSDPKATADALGPLSVKIYGDMDAAQQDALCAALTATAKKTRVEGATVSFYALENAKPSGSSFQASSLPSGNGEVNFGRGKAAPAGYKLKRTVKLQ